MIGTSPARDASDCDFVVKSDAQLKGKRSAHSQIRVDESGNDALADAVQRVLQATGYLPLPNVVVKIDSDGVSLGGAVTSYHLKQLAQSAVMRVPGVGRCSSSRKTSKTKLWQPWWSTRFAVCSRAPP
jgi:osmotically-inducible protein OsmY